MTTPLLLEYPSPNTLVPEPPLCLQLLAATCMKMPKTPCQEVEFPSLDSSNGPKVVHALIFLVVEIKVEILLLLLHQPLDLPMAALLDNARVNGDTAVLDLTIVVVLTPVVENVTTVVVNAAPNMDTVVPEPLIVELPNVKVIPPMLPLMLVPSPLVLLLE